MTAASHTRRGMLCLALGAGAAWLAADARSPRLFRRVGVAFGTTVSIALEAPDAFAAEAAFAAGFGEVRAIDRLTSLTRPGAQVFQLNRDGFLDRPDPALVEMLATAQAMHEATSGAFDVTIQPMWLAMDAAARRGGWPSDAEIAALRARVDQNRLRVGEDRIAFDQPGMAITLNSLARGLAADRVAAALTRIGVTNALFNTDVLGALGARPDGADWRAAVRDPRRAGLSIATADLRGCLATSGDYQYFWSEDHARNHIVDPRYGASPRYFSSVCVLAESGLVADALSTAAFLVGEEVAVRLLARFGAEALFIDKSGAVAMTGGFPGTVVAATS